MSKAMAPYISIEEDRIYILGEKKGLRALGEMLILKAKLGTRMSATFTDGINKPIFIECRNDLETQPLINFIDFFDPHNVDHCVAFREFKATEDWPEDFIPNNVVFHKGWEKFILEHMGRAWVKAATKGQVFGMPSEDQ